MYIDKLHCVLHSLGNLTVLIAILRRKCYRKFFSRIDLLLVHLAIADLMENTNDEVKCTLEFKNKFIHLFWCFQQGYFFHDAIGNWMGSNCSVESWRRDVSCYGVLSYFRIIPLRVCARLFGDRSVSCDVSLESIIFRIVSNVLEFNNMSVNFLYRTKIISSLVLTLS